MFLDREPWIYLWRPFYKSVVVRIPGSTPRKVRAFLSRQHTFAGRLADLEEQQRLLTNELLALRAENQRQWAAVEKLVLVLLGNDGSKTKS